jgi:hypothetical protein
VYDLKAHFEQRRIDGAVPGSLPDSAAASMMLLEEAELKMCAAQGVMAYRHAGIFQRP